MDVLERQRPGNPAKIWTIVGITVMTLIAACTVTFTILFNLLTTGTSTRNIYNIDYSGSSADTAEFIADMMGGNVVEVHAEMSGGRSAGTGFVITYDDSDNPIVMTNHHVIEGSSRIYVKTVYEAEKYAVSVDLLGYDEYHDIAILRMPAIGYKEGTFIDLMDAEGENFALGTFFASASYGEYLAAIGNALGSGLGIVDGICTKGSTVMFYNEKTPNKSIPVFQTTAAINSGMSGSPIFNKYGQIVGVGTYKASNADDVNFGVPISIALSVYKDVMAGNVNSSKQANLFGGDLESGRRYSANMCAIGTPPSIDYYQFNALGYTAANGYGTTAHPRLNISGVLLTGRGDESSGLLNQDVHTGLQVKSSNISGIRGGDNGDIITKINGVALTADYGNLFSTMYTLEPTTLNTKEPVMLTLSSGAEVKWENANYRVVVK